MAVVAQAYLHIEQNLASESYSDVQEYITMVTEILARETFGKPVHVEVDIEPGSTKMWATVFLSLVVLAQGYGNLRQAVEYAVRDAQTLSEKVRENVLDLGISESSVINFQRRLGDVGRIRRIFKRMDLIERGYTYGETAEWLRSLKIYIFDTLVGLGDIEEVELLLRELPVGLKQHFPEDERLRARAVQDRRWPDQLATAPLVSPMDRKIPHIGFDKATQKFISLSGFGSSRMPELSLDRLLLRPRKDEG